MLKEELKRYKMEHPVFYSTVPPLKTQCPVNYDWDKCSINEFGMQCRTCSNYNPLRILYQKELKGGYLSLGVPIEVILSDAEIQLNQ